VTAGGSLEGDLVVHLARFARALRARGVEVGVGDEVDAATALTLVEVTDRHEVRRALRTALKVRRRDWEAFDQVFDEVWISGRAATAARGRVTPPAPAGATRSWRGHGQGAEPGASDSPPAPEGGQPGYSPVVLLRRKPFDECSAADLAAMEQVLARLVPRLATRRSRRLVPTRGRGAVDLRRSLRRAVGTGGELVGLARRARALEEADIVVLCDTSGSMDAHTRFLLTFVLSLKRAARRTEVFAFNTSLTRLTPWIAAGRIGPTLERLARTVPDWSGGTKIGESLADFVARYQDACVTSRTVVVILSDGLDQGDTTLVAGAMRAIHARARRVVWLNPLCGDRRYEPTARAMQAALPYVDRLAPAHDLESLERLLPELGA
jgi:uncharacterized protein with von Willebrand factor type A (vWA) domain